MPLRPLASPVRLLRSPSLNPTVLADIPVLPVDLAGTAARDWLTTWSIARSMAARPEVVAALTDHGLTVTPLPGVSGVSAALMEAAAPWPTALDALVAAGDLRALPVADQLGDALTALVATLSTAPDEARRARPDWPEQHWERWRSVRTVVIGGGLVRGALGVHVVDRAAGLLPQLGVDLTITRAPDAAGLGLRGASSRLLGTGVALDCGGTAIKRARVSRSPDGQRVEPLAPVAAPGRVEAREVIDRIAEAAAGVTAVEVGATDRPLEVVLAIATYVDESGQPYSGQLGPYAPLGEIDFRAALAEAIERRVNSRVSVTVIHDGAAALLGARIEQPDADAVIMLGTAIGCSLTP
ncbi:MAG: hypothetical protein L0H96_26160 [Humibacillus sp.]|nr:hypothetical protein [Humibacillus sp.]MDN5780360.1 hypothetical protein [Humibacillus sp.]